MSISGVDCYRCGSEMKVGLANFEGEYAGRNFDVSAEGLLCPQCGYKTLHASQIDAFKTIVADAYRIAESLLTSTDIRKVRTQLRMSQDEFAECLNVGVASVKRWELGKAQDKSMDELIRLKCDLARAEQNVEDVLFSHGNSSEFSGNRPFSLHKLGHLILFFLQRAKAKHKVIGALHVNKLCWYADAWNFARSGVSITGTQYARLPLGPAIDEYRIIFKALQTQAFINAKKMDAFVPLREFDQAAFPSEEIGVMEQVWQSFGGRLGAIVDASHEEDAWKKTDHANLISYRLVNTRTKKSKA